MPEEPLLEPVEEPELTLPKEEFEELASVEDAEKPPAKAQADTAISTRETSATTARAIFVAGPRTVI